MERSAIRDNDIRARRPRITLQRNPGYASLIADVA